MLAEDPEVKTLSEYERLLAVPGEHGWFWRCTGQHNETKPMALAKPYARIGVLQASCQICQTRKSTLWGMTSLLVAWSFRLKLQWSMSGSGLHAPQEVVSGFWKLQGFVDQLRRHLVWKEDTFGDFAVIEDKTGATWPCNEIARECMLTSGDFASFNEAHIVVSTSWWSSEQNLATVQKCFLKKNTAASCAFAHTVQLPNLCASKKFPTWPAFASLDLVCVLISSISAIEVQSS